MTQETELPALPEPFDAWWEREGKAGNPFDLRRAFNAGRASAGPCGCREGECESKVGPRCRMANEVTTAAVLAERERLLALANSRADHEGRLMRHAAMLDLIDAVFGARPSAVKEG